MIHAATLTACLALGWGLAVVAMKIAPRLPRAGDRRALHQLALFAPLLALGLSGSWSAHMALTGCPMFTPLDGGATLALLLGVATLLAAALVGETRRLFRTYGQLGAIAADADEPGAALPVARLAIEIGVREPRVQLLATERPMACVAGMVRPTLFVSRGMLARLNERELEGLVAHELAHLRHQDNLIGWLDAIVFRAFRFLPPLRGAWAESLAEREEFADAVAARATGRPRALASALLNLAGEPAPGYVGTAGFASDGAGIERRIERLLATPDEPRRSWGLPAIAALAVACALPFATAWMLGEATACTVHLPGVGGHAEEGADR